MNKMPLPRKRVLEKHVERAGSDHARDRGVLHMKFTSPGHNSVPDRIVLGYVPPWLRDALAQCITFVEYKRSGQVPTPAQMREHARLRAMGFNVEVIDNHDAAKAMIERMNHPPKVVTQ